MQLTQSQVADLSNHFVGIRDSLEKFFNDPENQKAYQKWYLEKYGKTPEEEVCV